MNFQCKFDAAAVDANDVVAVDAVAVLDVDTASDCCCCC